MKIIIAEMAVLTNLTPDHLDRYGSMENYVRATARVFAQQQPFDWAIVQRRITSYNVCYTKLLRALPSEEEPAVASGRRF